MSEIKIYTPKEDLSPGERWEQKERIRETQKLKKQRREKSSPSTNIEKLEYLWVHLFGNRIMNVIYGANAVALSRVENQNDEKIAALIFLVSLFASIQVECGRSTAYCYGEALQELNKNGFISDKFARKFLHYDVEGILHGYCQLQGMYLASKKVRKIKEFRALKKRVATNIIPNI